MLQAELSTVNVVLSADFYYTISPFLSPTLLELSYSSSPNSKLLLMAIRGRDNHFLLRFSLFIVLTGFSYSRTDKLQKGQLLKDGEELVSAYGNFRLGFFSPENRKGRYLGIYYKRPADRTDWYNTDYDYYRYNIHMPECYASGHYPAPPPRNSQLQKPQPVWVANRNTPILHNESASLTIDSSDGNLKILRNGTNPIVISSVRAEGNTSATLLKNGNFVLYEMEFNASIRRELWQSFDYPTDTLLPGMKLGFDLQTGQRWFLRSRIRNNSPANGSYTLGMDLNNANKLVVWKGKEVFWTSDLLRNRSNVFSTDTVAFYNFSYTSNKKERYLSYSVNEDVTSFPVLTITVDGRLIDDTRIDISCSVFGGCRKDRTYGGGYGPIYNMEDGRKKWWLWLIIAVGTALIVLLLLYLGYLTRRKYKAQGMQFSTIFVVLIVLITVLESIMT